MSGKIKENMEIIGADGVHVGTVDRVEGNRIKLKKSDRGQHGLRRVGEGDEPTGDRRGYRYGDRLEQIADDLAPLGPRADAIFLQRVLERP